MKPIFIPLKEEYYKAFASGDKSAEMRRYGGSWNENNCRAGRKVVISKGYGKKERMLGNIIGLKRLHGTQFEGKERDAILAIYKTLDIEIAYIEISDLQPIQAM
jgi:hypothetical protein